MTMNATNPGPDFFDNDFNSCGNLEDSTHFYNLTTSADFAVQSATFDANLVCQPALDEHRRDSFNNLTKLQIVNEFCETRVNQAALMTKHYVLIPSTPNVTLNSNEEMKNSNSRKKRNQDNVVRAYRQHLSAEKRYRDSIKSKLDELRLQINCEGEIAKLKKRQLLSAAIHFIEKLKRTNRILTVENKYLRKMK